MHGYRWHFATAYVRDVRHLADVILSGTRWAKRYLQMTGCQLLETVQTDFGLGLLLRQRTRGRGSTHSGASVPQLQDAHPRGKTIDGIGRGHQQFGVVWIGAQATEITCPIRLAWRHKGDLRPKICNKHTS